MTKNMMEQTVEYLNESILSGRIPLGSPINEVEIANELGISRSPVREALKRLEAEGLVNYFPGRGSFVIEISKQDLEEIFEIRLLFEIEAFKESFRCIEKEFWDELEVDILSLGDDSSPLDYYAVDKKLHHTIIDCCGNKRLKIFYGRLEKQIDIVRGLSSRNPMHFKQSKQYHLRIVQAAKEGSYEKAQELLKKHIMDVKKGTIDSYLFNLRSV